MLCYVGWDVYLQELRVRSLATHLFQKGAQIKRLHSRKLDGEQLQGTHIL